MTAFFFFFFLPHSFFFFSPFGTGCVQTVAIIGPIFGFLLGSLCARLYVDIGFVKLGKGVYFYLFIHFSFYGFFLMGMV
jgi:hypothetical protein